MEGFVWLGKTYLADYWSCSENKQGEMDWLQINGKEEEEEEEGWNTNWRMEKSVSRNRCYKSD